ncbi:MAG: aminoacyl-tRNA deacylase [Acidimicrobiia bacterium]
MPADRVREYLQSQGVQHEITEHPQAYTAQELAAAEHVPGRQVAKSVMLIADDRLVMAVLPAPKHVSLAKAKDALGSDQVRLAKENEFDDAFPDCEVGAEPPFGNLYDVPVYLDESLNSDQIVFSAGNYTEAIRVSVDDYLNLVEPTKVDVAAGE